MELSDRPQIGLSHYNRLLTKRLGNYGQLWRASYKTGCILEISTSMQRSPKVGAIGELSFVVTEQHAIDFADNEMPAVLSTPWLVWFLEHSARSAMLPLLDPGESTVGTHVDVEHLAPTPVGHQVTCKARVINVDGTQISFQFEAHDQHEQIARGIHKLQVIQVSRFQRRVGKKRTNDEP